MPDEVEIPFEQLLGEWESEQNKRAGQIKRTMRRMKWSALPLGLAVLSLPFWSGGSYLPSSIHIAFLLLASLPSVVYLAGMFNLLVAKREMELFAQMMRLQDKRILPIFLSGWRSSNVTLPAPLLIKLLESVEASDAELLRESQYEILVLVKRDYYADGATTHEQMLKVKYAALHALQQVGGQVVLSEMERLAVRMKQSRENPPLLEAIEDCLPAVRQRAAESHSAQILLRASQQTQTQSGDTLLRAASASHETQSDQLLRAGSQNAPLDP